MELEKAPHGGLGVSDAPLGRGDPDDAGDGPPVGGEAVGECTLSKEVGEGGELVPRHEGGAAGARGGSDGPRPSLIDRALPVANGGRRDPEKSGNIGLRTTLREEFETLESTLLEGGSVAMSLGPPRHSREERRARILDHLISGQELRDFANLGGLAPSPASPGLGQELSSFPQDRQNLCPCWAGAPQKGQKPPASTLPPPVRVPAFAMESSRPCILAA